VGCKADAGTGFACGGERIKKIRGGLTVRCVIIGLGAGKLKVEANRKSGGVLGERTPKKRGD